jgi:hypothetical protein
MKSVTLVLFALITKVCFGLSISPEPLTTAFSRFEASYIGRCEGLLAEVSAMIATQHVKKFDGRLSALRSHLGNLKRNAPLARIWVLNPDPRDPPPATPRILAPDIAGFRRVLDALLIEAAASKAITLSDAFLAKLRVFWDEESYFATRFASE